MFKKKVLTTASLHAASEQVERMRRRATNNGNNIDNKSVVSSHNNNKNNKLHETTTAETSTSLSSSHSSRSSVFDLGKSHISQEESFTQLLDAIKHATAPECDLDEVIQNNKTTIRTVDSSEQSCHSNNSSSSSSLSENVAALSQERERLSASYTVLPHSHSESVAPLVLTYRSFAASLTCPKKFYLFQYRPDLIPRTPIGEVVHFDDTVGFNELARRWDRLQFGSKATVINETDFNAAVRHTEETILNYFHTIYDALGEQAPSLTIHRPAFAAPFGGHRLEDKEQHRKRKPSSSSSSESSHSQLSMSRSTESYNFVRHPLILRARPTVLRFRPKDNQWVLLESQAINDPQGSTAKAAHSLQRMHFTTLAFRYWITQPHIPISLRKRFLNIDLDEITSENLKGHILESSAEVASPIDLKRSGLLHIRQYFPGPATLLDCDPPRLVKFIQRLSLEDMIEYDERISTAGNSNSSSSSSNNSSICYNSHHGSAAFDLHHLESLDPAIWTAYHKFKNVVSDGTRHGINFAVANNRANRSQRQRDLLQHQRFELQQRLLESLIQHHTLKLVERAKDVKQIERWTTFSRETPDGLVHSTYAVLEEAEREQNEREKAVAAVNTSQNKLQSNSKKSKSDKNNNNNNSNSNSIMMCDTRNKSVRELNRMLPCIPIVPCFSENIGTHCSRGELCPFFVEGMCLPQKVYDPITIADNHVFTLPSSAVSRKVVWWAQGIRTIRDALYQYKKGNIKLTATQLRYVKAVSEGCVAVNRKEILAFFSKIRYPAFIIDFEAVQFALPPFEKVVAYQSVPFQFSLDVFQHDILNETPTHYDFLHFGKGYSPNADPRKSCIAELMRIVKLERDKKKEVMTKSGELARLEREAEEVWEAECSNNGKSKRGRVMMKKKKEPKVTKNNPLEAPLTPYDGCFIAHFASYEKSCLEKLGQLEEEYKEDIKHFFFLDTMDLFKKGFIHPNAHGSNSLKKVLPAMCPDFQYGVFGNEGEDENEHEDTAICNNNSNNSSRSSSSSSNSSSSSEGASLTLNGVSDSEGQQDEQRGDNAMGVYRLWYHQEGGSTIQELQRSQRLSRSPLDTFQFQRNATTSSLSSLISTRNSTLPKLSLIPADLRERTWSLLRIQLLEYCSLDTRALYEIMREMWKEAEAVKDILPQDKSGWVFVTPQAREITLEATNYDFL